MKSTIPLSLIAIFCLLGFQFCTQVKTQSADLVLLNGKIWTGLDSSSFSEAVAIYDNTISHVGTTQSIKKYIGSNTEVIDLNKKLVIPGFNDAHIHFLVGSLGLSEINLSGSGSIDEISRRIKTYAEENPDKEWITGRGWQYTHFPEGLPTRHALDSIISDRPIYISAYDGHSAWVNSKALQHANIDRNSRFSGYGEIVKDNVGNPTGALKEEAMNLVAKLISKPTREDKLKALKIGMNLAASLGITSFQNAKGSPDELSLYEELLSDGELSVRVSMAFLVDSRTTDAEIETFTQIKNRLTNNPMIRASAVKFMLDGVIESHTGAMIEPYSDLSGKGTLSMPIERYREMVSNFDSLGFQVYTHAIGDRAVRESLNTYEFVKKQNGTTNARHRIEHIEMISTEDMSRFSEIGVIASMQPIHAEPGTSGVWSKAVGKERLQNAFAWRSLLDNDAKLVFSSDWPACASINPIRGLHTAVTRRTTDGHPADGWVPAQKITIAEALIAYTQGGAYSTFDENVKGKLAPGYLADMIVLSSDLFAIDPMKTHEASVFMTIFNGKIIYEYQRQDK